MIRRHADGPTGESGRAVSSGYGMSRWSVVSTVRIRGSVVPVIIPIIVPVVVPVIVDAVEEVPGDGDAERAGGGVDLVADVVGDVQVVEEAVVVDDTLFGGGG